MSLKKLLMFGGLGLVSLLLVVALWPKPKVVQQTPNVQVGAVDTASQPSAEMVFYDQLAKANTAYSLAVNYPSRYNVENYYRNKATCEMISAQLGGPSNGYACNLANLPPVVINRYPGISVVPLPVTLWLGRSRVVMAPTVPVVIGQTYSYRPPMSVNGRSVTVINNVPPYNPARVQQQRTNLPNQQRTTLPNQQGTTLPNQQRTPLPNQQRTPLPPAPAPTPIVGGSTVPGNTAVNQTGSTGRTLWNNNQDRRRVSIPSGDSSGRVTTPSSRPRKR